MKISVITLHRIVNYGSVLQAFATQMILEKLGHQVEIIDYYDERMTMLGMFKRLKKKKRILSNPIACFIAQTIMAPSYFKRFRTFGNFIGNHLNLSKKTYRSNEELKSYPTKADCFCTGSDQVWNSGWNEKIDKAFFLDFVPTNKPCFAYAASFGKSELDDWEIDETKQLLSKYIALSCREQQATIILKQLGYDSEHVLDPTLLLTDLDWKTLASSKYKSRKFIFVYNLNRNKKIDADARLLRKATGLPILTVSYCYHEIPFRVGKTLVNPSVEDFLSLLANASYVLTDSFHATAFSINFSREVFVYFSNLFSSRLASIVSLVGIQHRIVNEKDIFEAEKFPINFDKVNDALNVERAKSITFLKNALSNASQRTH